MDQQNDPQDPAEVMYVLALRYEDGQQGQWRTKDYAVFKQTVDTLRANFRKRSTVLLGNPDRPEDGFTCIDMNYIIAFETAGVKIAKAPSSSPGITREDLIAAETERARLAAEAQKPAPPPVVPPTAVVPPKPTVISGAKTTTSSKDSGTR